MRIALVQQKAGHDREDNIRRGLQALEEAAQKGADVVCYAELAFEPFYPQFPAKKGYEQNAEPVPGPITEKFSRKARELGIVVVLNLFEKDGNCCYDCSPVIDADGTVVGKTRMVHIADHPHFHEQSYYTPGDNTELVYPTKVGKIGIAICYDRHYPEYMRALGLQGAELVVIPQAGAIDEWPKGLQEAEVRVAAFQNGYFAALCNRVGAEEQLEFSGESFVCGPNGAIVTRAARSKEQLLYADVNLEETNQSHAQKLFLRDRRPSLYSRWLAG